jgi:hypothetical protein
VPHIQQEWPSWVDLIGNTYRIGDTVAVAVGGNSPQQVIGVVLRINKTTKSGAQIVSGFGKNQEESCSVQIEVLARGGRYSHFGTGSNQTQTYDNPNRIVKIRSAEIPPEELTARIEDILRIERATR